MFCIKKNLQIVWLGVVIYLFIYRHEQRKNSEEQITNLAIDHARSSKQLAFINRKMAFSFFFHFCVMCCIGATVFGSFMISSKSIGEMDLVPGGVCLHPTMQIVSNRK